MPLDLDCWLMLASGRPQLYCKGKNAVLLVPGALTPDRWYHVAFRHRFGCDPRWLPPFHYSL